MVFRNGLPSNAGIPINFRLDGNLFNIRRLQVKTKVSSDTIFDLQYADDAAYSSRTPTYSWPTCCHISTCWTGNQHKENWSSASVCEHIICSPSYLYSSQWLAQRRAPVHHLGSILTSDCDLNNEIQLRVMLTSAAFGRLSHWVFLNHNLATATKIAVYKAICISILLYGCESWTPYRCHIKTLEAFHIWCLKSILGIHWWHKVTHVEIRHRATGIDWAEHLLLQRQLLWVGHIICMPSNRLPHHILYGELVNGQRLPGGPWVAVHGPHPLYPEQVQYLYCRTGAAFNWPRHMEKCLCQRLGNIQCVCRSSSWGSMYPQAQSSQPTNYWSEMPTVQPNLCFRVRPAQPSTESCLTSTSATLPAAQTSLLNSTDYCKQAFNHRKVVCIETEQDWS